MLQQAGKTFQTELLKMHPNYKQLESSVKQPNPFDKKYSADIERTTVMVSMRIETAEDRLTLSTNETYSLALNTSDSGVLEVKVLAAYR